MTSMFNFCPDVNNTYMNIYKYFNKLQCALLTSFLLASILLTASHLFALAEGRQLIGRFADLGTLADSLAACAPYCLCFFITLYFTDGKRSVKAFWAVICCLAVLKISGADKYSYILPLLCALLAIYCFKNFELYLAASLSFITSVICGVLLSFFNDAYKNFLMTLARLVSGKGVVSSALFGFVNTFFELFNAVDFKNLFYHNSYGGTAVNGQSIITGAADIFAYSKSSAAAQTYLSGHYLELLLLCGVFVFLLSQLKKGQKTALIFTYACAALSGNFSLFLLFILLESPFLFLSVAVLCALGYAAANALNISIGFAYGGSVFELFAGIDKPVYLAAAGAVFVAVGYFAAEYFAEKYGISDCYNLYYPARLEKTVAALGGVRNMLRFKDGALEVRNPKLVNTLALDCTVAGNKIKSCDPLFSELKNYIT